MTGTPAGRAPGAVRLGQVAAGAGALVVLAVFLLLLFGRPAPARLSAVEPGAGAVLATGPVEVSLVFTAVPAPVVTHLTVTGPDGRVVSRAGPTVTGRRIVVPVRATVAGVYRVAYHVQLSDGSQLSGTSGFTVSGDSGSVGDSGSPGWPADGAQPADGAVPGVGAVPAGGGTDEAAGHAHLRRDGWSLALIGIDLLLIAAIVVVVTRPPRRRRAPRPPGQGPARHTHTP